MSAVASWFEATTSLPDDGSRPSDHVDDLMPEAFEADPVGTSLRCFEELVRIVRNSQRDEIVLLVISVPGSMQMITRPPSHLRADWLKQRPPSLYLLPSPFWSRWGEEEEYRIQVRPSWFSSPSATVHYRVHRDSNSTRKGWEFGRSFYLHSWPDP